MASQGPLYPGTVTTEAGPSGDNDWTSPGNISADDGNLASITAATFDAGDDSFRLKAQNFGFTIPAGATIDGIIVEIERSNAAGASSDNEVRLYDSTGTLVGDNKAAAGDWPTDLTLATYGSSSDTWAAGLDQTDIVDADFGVAFIVNADGANTDIAVDFIRVTVHYTEAPLSETPTPGGVTIGGVAPAPRAAAATGGVAVIGASPLTRALASPGGALVAGAPPAAVAQSSAGGVIVGGIAPAFTGFVDPATIGGVVVGGVGPVARAVAVAGGVAVLGVSPSARAVVGVAGALVGGVSPSVLILAQPGGVVVGGQAPSIVAGVVIGAVTLGGIGPSVVVLLASGGVVVGGLAPTEEIGGGGISETPSPGGVVVGGNGPAALAGALAGGLTVAGASLAAIAGVLAGGLVVGGVSPSSVVLVTPGSVLVGGFAPTEGGLLLVLTSSFGAPSPSGQVSSAPGSPRYGSSPGSSGFDAPKPIGQVDG